MPIPHFLEDLDDELAHVWSPAGGGGPGYQRTPGPTGTMFPLQEWMFSRAEQVLFPGTYTKLPLPPVYNATSDKVGQLAQQGLPPNVTVNTTGNAQPKPQGTAGQGKPADDKGDDDDSIHLGVDSSVGGNLGGSSGVPVQVSLVAKNFDLHPFLRRGKRFVDIGHEPSLNLTLTFDGVHLRDVLPAAQLAVSAVNLHILQNSQDDILEAALTGGFTRDQTGWSGAIGVQTEYHLNPSWSFLFQANATIWDQDNGWKMQWRELTVTGGILWHMRK